MGTFRIYIGNIRILRFGDFPRAAGLPPFGAEWTQSGMPTSGNRYTFSGKERQDIESDDCITTPLHDFGARFYDSDGVTFIQQDRLRQYVSPYVYCKNNPINNIDVDGNWSVSNHYIMTMKSLALYGIIGQQAELLSYYASMYADNTEDGFIFLNNLVHQNVMLFKRNDIDHSGTAISQETNWDPSSPHENANIRHSMRSNWEAQAYAEGREGGISKRNAQLRGMQFGWKNILSSAQMGSLSSFVKDSEGIQMFGVGLHALQDGYGHAGVSMEEHKPLADVFGNKKSSMCITQSAIYGHQMTGRIWVVGLIWI